LIQRGGSEREVEKKIAGKCLEKTVRKNREEMTIIEAQDSIDQWIKKFGVRYFNELTNMALMTEEVGELARIIARKYGEQSFKESDLEKTLEEEMADILFVLICMANQTGINLEEALVRNLEKKTNRDAERHLNNDKLK
jgi:NTP pyrophosphatase (non-canonical NTP hydrolase)